MKFEKYVFVSLLILDFIVVCYDAVQVGKMLS